MKYLELINRWIERAETIILVIILSMMVLLAFSQVILRSIFDMGILWADTFLRHLVLWVGFIGASLATRERKHINIDVLRRLLKGRAKSSIYIVTNLFAAFIALLLADAAWTFVRDERSMGTILFNDIPAWYFQTIIPAGFLLMSLRFAILTVESIVDVVKKAENS